MATYRHSPLVMEFGRGELCLVPVKVDGEDRCIAVKHHGHTGKKPLERLSEDDVDLTVEAPELILKFKSSEHRDHALAALYGVKDAFAEHLEVLDFD